MLYRYEDGVIKPVPYCDYSEFQGKEKDLENLLSSHFKELYEEIELSLMPIFQERPIKREPDIFALDIHGNLVIFELKRGNAGRGAVEQIMHYAENFSRRDYDQLNDMYKKYVGNNEVQLKDEHAATFGLSAPLSNEAFNRTQKLIIVGNSADIELMNAVDYWKSRGIDIDFLPYRFYTINGEIYFEFFAKPYDYHVKPSARKGIMFNTNRTYSPDGANERGMLERKHVEAYGGRGDKVYVFNQGDYVLFYANVTGIIAIGKITSREPQELLVENAPDATAGGLYHEVEMIVPQGVSDADGYNQSLYPSEIKELLNRNITFLGTYVNLYLNEEQVNVLIDALREKYND